MSKKEDKNLIIYNKISELIVEPKSELEFSSVFELLIAVMLSAQCTDKRVNIITRKLFKKYLTPISYANAKLEDLEQDIKSCNYYHNKAKNIIATCKILVEKYGGQVPFTHEELIKLPGVGNKTANVVEAVGFGKQALPVDTHVLRVSNRLGFVNTSSPDKCEQELKKIFESCDYAKLHHILLLFGRYYCVARNPKCNNCVIAELCKYKNK